ncbi:MAG: hypothetical protein ACFCVD_20680, partial [Nodosilinea sp.]
CGIQPSVNAAYKAKAAEIHVNRSAVYQKLNGVETQVSAALLRETAAELGPLIQQMGGSSPPLLAAYEPASALPPKIPCCGCSTSLWPLS